MWSLVILRFNCRLLRRGVRLFPACGSLTILSSESHDHPVSGLRVASVRWWNTGGGRWRWLKRWGNKWFSFWLGCWTSSVPRLRLVGVWQIHSSRVREIISPYPLLLSGPAYPRFAAVYNRHSDRKRKTGERSLLGKGIHKDFLGKR